MAKKTVTLHMYAKTGQWDAEGATDIYSVDFRGIPACMKDRVWLGQQDVDMDIPDVDVNQAKIDALQAEIQRERADSEVRVNLLLERIGKLQCLAHEVVE